ncbi:hypothetical protein [Actinoallomurus iriomotensis]|uniref:Uncharacterized protein n=1 Tax=Actinoallomurus iriomotensis TaxID=478107 RepID=A0A9W6VLV7_9ACTN|nr:hypothetical protein [Actinoallomurus iriomotensis]GLY71842.1 hypothetical protein Airi01_001090 [Actinoallomurus iriomotensis]GLY82631.1 hypothetical protein Airi02_005620 [Actinoallomurus iriomotensis]
MSEMGYVDAEERERKPSRRRRPARGSNRNLLIIGGAAVVVLIVVVVIAMVTMGGGDDKKGQAAAAARVTPKVYVNTPANSLVNKLNERSKDKRPLNKSEVFGDDAKSVSHGNYHFTLVGSQLSDCASVTWGQELQNDLRKYGCTQVARGAYVSQDKKYLGQFVAMNLEQLQGAEQVVRDLDPNSKAGFVSPLAAQGAENFGSGFSAAYSQSFGHYVVISWVERAGGAQPQTMNELLDASIAIERADDFVWERLVLAGG